MKYILFLALALSFSTLFGQQLLWTTSEKSGEKYIPIENINEKVLNFYEHYKFYYDGTGYSKEGFTKSFQNSDAYKKVTNKSIWEELYTIIKEIKKPTVLAFKDNPGNGSIVFVICITKDNVNIITFSNKLESDAISTGGDKESFLKWFKTLLE